MSSPVPHRIALTARLNIEVRDVEQRCWSAGAAGVVFDIQQIVYEIEQDLVERFEPHLVELNWCSLDVKSSVHLVQVTPTSPPDSSDANKSSRYAIPVTPTSPPDTQPVVTVATSSTTDPPVGTPPGPESSITAPPIQVPLADQMPVVTLAHQTQTLPRTRSRSPFLNPEVRLRRNRNLRRHKVPCVCRCRPCWCACGCGRCGFSLVPGRDPDPDPEPRSVRGMCRQGVCADCLNGVAPRTEARPVLPFQLTDEYVMELHQRVCIGELLRNHRWLRPATYTPVQEEETLDNEEEETFCFGGANSRGGDFGQ
jgi:hypothetical protein